MSLITDLSWCQYDVSTVQEDPGKQQIWAPIISMKTIPDTLKSIC